MLCTRKSLNVLFNVTWMVSTATRKFTGSLMEEAEEFFETELENQEELYDEEEDN